MRYSILDLQEYVIKYPINFPGMKSSKFLDHVREVIRTNHFSYSTEKTYVSWIYRFIIFHNKRHPEEMGGKEISEFLTYLAVDIKVSASTQNQALNALVFLYTKVIKTSLDAFDFKHVRIGKRLPVVFSRNEVQDVLSNLNGEFHLMASLLYGSGLRLTECMRLRVKDIDLRLNEIIVRAGKGDNDRRTLLPRLLIPQLKRQIEKTKIK
jgi:integrase